MDPVAPTSVPGYIVPQPDGGLSQSIEDSATATGSAVVALSKSARKRIERQARQAAERPARRAAEKSKKRLKKEEKRKLVQLGVIEQGPSSKIAKKAAIPVTPDAPMVVIDLGFDEMMSDKEIKSLNTQLAFCHSANRKSEHPVKLLYSSFSGQLRKRIESFGKTHENWKGVEWWEEGYEHLWQGFGGDAAKDDEMEDVEEPASLSNANAVASTSKVLIGHDAGKPRSTAVKSDIVYLTGDSPNIIASFEPGKTYILGGIVDRNRYKLLCYDKAVQQGISHAALPIGQYLPELKTRYILTVNQVFEIMLKWREMRDWGKAFRHVMPMRKLKPEPEKLQRKVDGDEDISVIIDVDDELEENDEYDADAAEEAAIAAAEGQVDVVHGSFAAEV